MSWFIILALIVCLIVVLVYGKITNQARSWINLFGGIKFQPSEFIKVATIVWMAFFCTSKKRSGFKSYLLLFAIIGLITILIILQPDLGTASIYAMIVFLMFMALNISKKVKRNILLTVVGMGLVVVILLMNNGVQLFFERQLARFDYFNPCSEEKFYDTGTQLCNGFIAFNNGGLTGLGLGNSTQKYLYLPEAYTDFIFAIITEELGVIVAVGILLLMMIVLWRIFIISKRASTELGRLMCYGIFWYILLHIVINLGGIMGLIPLTGVPLPFMSYGGSFLMCLIVSITIVLRVDMESKN
jgi:cell division protein FtsW